MTAESLFNSHKAGEWRSEPVGRVWDVEAITGNFHVGLEEQGAWSKQKIGNCFSAKYATAERSTTAGL